LFVALALSLPAPQAQSKPSLPANIGDCVRTQIKQISHRLGDTDIGSGSALIFANGLSQVSYDELPEVGRSHLRDPVLMCLVYVPQDCPKGDKRGKIYTTTNLRTIQSWTLGDSEHSCGGA
jgi:hypothetical protein